MPSSTASRTARVTRSLSSGCTSAPKSSKRLGRLVRPQAVEARERRRPAQPPGAEVDAEGARVGSVEREEQLLRAQAAEWLRAERRSHRDRVLRPPRPASLAVGGRRAATRRGTGTITGDGSVHRPRAAARRDRRGDRRRVPAARQALASRPRRRAGGRRADGRDQRRLRRPAGGRVAARRTRRRAAGAGGHARRGDARASRAAARGAAAARARPRAAVALDEGEAVALVTPAATWASPRTLLAVTDRRLLWLLDDAPTHRVRSLPYTAIAEHRPPAAPPAAEGRGAAGAHEERAHATPSASCARRPRPRSPGTSRPRAWPRWGGLVSSAAAVRAAARAVLHAASSRGRGRRAREPGPRVIDLGRGNPDLPPPPHAIEALRAAARETDDPDARLPEVPGRCPTCARRSPSATGSTTASSSTPTARSPSCPGRRPGSCSDARRRRAGDGVLLPDPGYPDYLSGVALAGARRVAAPARRRRRLAARLRRRAPPSAPRCAAVLNYPSNPCAVCAAAGTFEARRRVRPRATGTWLAQRPRLRLPGLRRAPRARACSRSPGAREVAVELWSPSKIYGMAGWRIGFAGRRTRSSSARIRTLVDHAMAGVFIGHPARPDRRADAATRRDVAERRECTARRRDTLVAALRRPAPRSTRRRGRSTPGGGCRGLTPEGLPREHRIGVAPARASGRAARAGCGCPRAADEDLAEGARPPGRGRRRSARRRAGGLSRDAAVSRAASSSASASSAARPFATGAEVDVLVEAVRVAAGRDADGDRRDPAAQAAFASVDDAPSSAGGRPGPLAGAARGRDAAGGRRDVAPPGRRPSASTSTSRPARRLASAPRRARPRRGAPPSSSARRSSSAVASAGDRVDGGPAARSTPTLDDRRAACASPSARREHVDQARARRSACRGRTTGGRPARGPQRASAATPIPASGSCRASWPSTATKRRTSTSSSSALGAAQVAEALLADGRREDHGPCERRGAQVAREVQQRGRPRSSCPRSRARQQPPPSRTRSRVPAAKTVSRWAAKTTASGPRRRRARR